jgi:hypothetical protein
MDRSMLAQVEAVTESKSNRAKLRGAREQIRGFIENDFVK